MERIIAFIDRLGDIVSTILSVVQALWYGLTSILTGLWDLIVQVFDGGVFSVVTETFVTLGNYVGTPVVVFMSTMLFLIIFRIGVAFVFKIFTFRLDYRTKSAKMDYFHKQDMRKGSSLFPDL